MWQGSVRYLIFRWYSTSKVRCLDALKRPAISEQIFDRTRFSRIIATDSQDPTQ
ncbi:hypothetical protein MXB_4342 [Myxobolus squamalis]|nr:hypothetical protein MXB_4342 [Myxobolus squamalis]